MVKRPAWKEQPRPQKVAKSVAVPTYHDFRPSWRIGDMVLAHDDFGFHQIDSSALKNLQQRLRGYECRSWREILHSKQHPDDHFMPVADISKEAQELLERSGVGDVDEVVSLRVGKKCRMWGIMQSGGTLLILWWDPKHLVYKMNVKSN
ncbi:MAG TPA: hypothetical protein VGA84_00480 [Thermoanaerobaculia bacterium]